MQQTNAVTILATQLATTDRRALSQAWYSALHLAEGERSGVSTGTPPRTACVETSSARREIIAGEERGAPRERVALARHSTRHHRLTAAPAFERRAPKTELSRRIERVLARRRPFDGTASFAISVAEGRVHVLVRSDGGRTRVVAICAPTLRERVERALGHTRYALATHRAEVA
jgi:hypothetical protein